MKIKNLFIASGFLMLVIVSAGCSWRNWFAAKPSQTSPAPTYTTFTLNPASSTLTWDLKKVRGFTGIGAMEFSGGSFVMSEGAVVSGKLTLNTDTLVKNGGNTLAADHFKFDTFLNAAKYLKVTFESTEMHSVDVRAEAPRDYEITGTLSAGFSSRSITFPITFVEKDGALTGDAVISIPRDEVAARTELPSEVGAFVDKGKATVTLHLVALSE